MIQQVRAEKIQGENNRIKRVAQGVDVGKREPEASSLQHFDTTNARSTR